MSEEPDKHQRSQSLEPRETTAGGNASLEALMQAANAGSDVSSGHRPVENWNPPYCGDIGMRIAGDGTWFYQNGPIGRHALVKLFAGILRKDVDGKTYLVTPVEKVLVTVADAPFLAVEMAATGSGPEQSLTFRTNLDDVVTVDARHPLRFERQASSGGMKPYVLVRGRLEALATRAVYAELMALAEPRADGQTALGVWSGGIWWKLTDEGVT